MMSPLTTRPLPSSSSFLRSFSSSEHKRNNNNDNDDKSNNDDDDNSSQSRSGNIFIGIGWILLGLVAIDQLLQYKQEQELKKRHLLLDEMQREADDANVPTFDASLPTLYRCKLLHVEPTLDGTKMLTRNGKSRTLKVGDVVEILQDNVGPNRAYHLCRLLSTDNNNNNNNNKSITAEPFVGWYPVNFLERVD
jgi:hypothetical protein